MAGYVQLAPLGLAVGHMRTKAGHSASLPLLEHYRDAAHHVYVDLFDFVALIGVFCVVLCRACLC